jgi:hypothetical protein
VSCACTPGGECGGDLTTFLLSLSEAPYFAAVKYGGRCPDKKSIYREAFKWN